MKNWVNHEKCQKTKKCKVRKNVKHIPSLHKGLPAGTGPHGDQTKKIETEKSPPKLPNMQPILALFAPPKTKDYACCPCPLGFWKMPMGEGGVQGWLAGPWGMGRRPAHTLLAG